MSSRNLPTTTAPKEPFSKTGPQAGVPGAPKPGNGSETGISLEAIAKLTAAGTHLTGLMQSWRCLPVGEKLATVMTPEERQKNLSLVSSYLEPGDARMVNRIVKRLLGNWGGARVTDSGAEDRVRILLDDDGGRPIPLLSIWAAYERAIREPREWPPDGGTFREMALSHARMMANLHRSLKGE